MTRKGFHDATTDPAQIAAWWRKEPQANIGLACGISFEVADFDVRVRQDGTRERSSLDAALELNRHALLAPAAGIAETRHGGWHLYFPASGLGVEHWSHQAVDLLGRGSYVVAPPSVVPPDAGIRGPGRYSWIRFPRLDAAAPADWPQWRQLLRPLAPQPRRVWATTGSAEGLAQSVRQARPGTRNTLTYRALRQALREGLPIHGICEASVASGLALTEVQGILASARRLVVVTDV